MERHSFLFHRYGPETKWSSVREAQMKEVLTEVKTTLTVEDILVKSDFYLIEILEFHRLIP